MKRYNQDINAKLAYIRMELERERPQFVRGGAGRAPVSPRFHGRRPQPFTDEALQSLKLRIDTARDAGALGRLVSERGAHFTDWQLYWIYRMGVISRAEAVCMRHRICQSWDNLGAQAIVDWVDRLDVGERDELFRQGLLTIGTMPTTVVRSYLRLA